MPDVRCSVSNCTHWGQGNYCQASEILVQTEPYAYAMEFSNDIMSSVLNGEMTTSAAHSAETCCQTFKPK